MPVTPDLAVHLLRTLRDGNDEDVAREARAHLPRLITRCERLEDSLTALLAGLLEIDPDYMDTLRETKAVADLINRRRAERAQGAEVLA
jgi:uncharacterized protein (UPF0335 family)